MHVDRNADVELALHPSDCVLDHAGRWIDPAKVMSCNCLDYFSVPPEIPIKLRSTARPLKPGEDAAFILLCGFERKSVAVGDG